MGLLNTLQASSLRSTDSCWTKPDQARVSPTSPSSWGTAFRNSLSRSWSASSEAASSPSPTSYRDVGLSPNFQVVKGGPSARIVGLGWLWFWLLHSLPGSAWTDGKLSEFAEQLGKIVEHRRSKSTRSNYPRRWTTHPVVEIPLKIFNQLNRSYITGLYCNNVVI